jgi:hypothetical protein
MVKATSRRRQLGMDRFTERQFAPYVTAIGQSVLAWNSLQEMLGWTFEIILFGTIATADNNQIPQARGAWNSLNSDRDKRRLLRAAAARPTKIQQRNYPHLYEDVKWILDRIDELENDRNNAVHSPLMLMSAKYSAILRSAGIVERVIPDSIRGDRRALNMQDKELLAEFRRCRDTALVLRDFVTEIDRALRAVGYAWPERPSLPARTAKKTRSPRKRLDPTE